MKKPTTLPTLEGSEQHLSKTKLAVLVIIAAICIGMLLAPWSN